MEQNLKGGVMKRRDVLQAGTVTLAAAATAALGTFPGRAFAAEKKYQWKMVTAWPKNLPGPGVAAQLLADMITSLSGGRLEVKLYAAGEIVPGPGVFDAVSQGTAEMYHAVPAYWGSKSKGILLFGSQPFGLRADEQVGWMKYGGGQELYDEMYGRFGIKPFLCGNSGPQWAGWFKKEIKSAEDFKGLRFRTTGLASEMLSKMGMAVQAMGGGAMFQALQSGAIDAGEFIGPWSDSALGFHQIAKYYYWPGIGEPSSAEECGVNMKAYNELPKELQDTVRYACDSLYNIVWTEYTTKHAMALQQMVSDHGVQVKKLPDDVMVAMGNAAGQVIEDLRSHSDELVRKITDSYLKYRNLVANYNVYAENGQLNARALKYKY